LAIRVGGDLRRTASVRGLQLMGSRVVENVHVEEERVLGAAAQLHELAVEGFSFFRLAKRAELDGLAALTQDGVRVVAFPVHEDRVGARRIVIVVSSHSPTITISGDTAHVGGHPTWTVEGSRDYNGDRCIPSGIIRFCSSQMRRRPRGPRERST